MMRALYTGVQGLRAHQVRMDVIGNNIANVNTTAFKGSRVNFSDVYSQTLSGATSPTASQGGMNPKQVGLGVGVASIDTIQTEGSMQMTGQTTDMAISGQGFFVVKDGGRFVYTRAGNFDFDANGYLVNRSTGQRVQGWMPNAAGVFPNPDASTMSDINLPVGGTVLAKATTKVTFDQLLNAAAPVGTVHTSPFTVIDSLGNKHTLMATLTKSAANVWDVAVTGVGAAVVTGPVTSGGGAAGYVGTPPQLLFSSSGALLDNDANSATPVQVTVTNYAPGGGAANMTFNLDLTKVAQPALQTATTNSTLLAIDADGYTQGALDKISVDGSGVITGEYSNGELRAVGQVALANFSNPGALSKVAGNNWAESNNSGMARVGPAGEGGRGTVAANNLEMSNVDISEEFTNMIVTQRGFQANSKIITTSDEMLQELVNLKR